jgi:hypothetical protein
LHCAENANRPPINRRAILGTPIAELAKLKVGMPWEKGVNITPLAELGKSAYLAGSIDDAREQNSSISFP